MTVQDVIEKLKEMPKDANVWIFVDDESAKANDVYIIGKKVYVGCEHEKK